MSNSLPVLRSAPARNVFLVSAGIGVALLLWIMHLRALRGTTGLTPIYFLLLTYFDYLAAIGMLLMLAVAVFVPAAQWQRTLLSWLGGHPGAIAGATTLVLAACVRWVYLNHPLSMDEYAPYLQSQAFAAGELTGRFPAPLIDWLTVPGFQNSFLVVSADTGRVASVYWPGFALLLTPFTLIGIPWLCNPALTGLSVLAMHRLAIRLTQDRSVAGMAMLFTIASPVVFADGISYYSMTAHMLANIVFVLLLLDATPRRLVLAGLVGSFALVLHNPLPHLLFALPWGVWLLTRKHGVRQVAWLIAGYLPLGLLLGVGWHWFTTDYLHRGPLDMAIHAAAIPSGPGALFGFPSSAVITARLTGLAKIWLWATPTLVVLAALGVWRHRADHRVRLLMLSGLITLVGYCFVLLDQGHGWGYRYFHSAWFILPLLGALAFLPSASDATPVDENLRALAVTCAALSLVAGLGQRALQMHEFIAANLEQQPAYSGTEPQIVFINPSESFYGYDLIQNDAFLRSPRIVMLSRSPADNAALMAALKPEFRRVHIDRFGEVWSAAPVQVSGRPPPQ